MCCAQNASNCRASSRPRKYIEGQLVTLHDLRPNATMKWQQLQASAFIVTNSEVMHQDSEHSGQPHSTSDIIQPQ